MSNKIEQNEQSIVESSKSDVAQSNTTAVDKSVNINVATTVVNTIGSQDNATVQKKRKFFTVENISVMAILTAVSFILYMFVKFPLPFIFPSFLDIQFSDMPALLGGFALGPVAGSLIIIVKCCIKMFFSTTACVGELADILVGLAFVLPASIFYHKCKTKRSAIYGILIGAGCAVVVAIVANWLMLIPFYVEFLFQGDAEKLLSMMQVIYPNATMDNMLAYYLPLAVLPFNILRCSICGLITFFVYKPLSKALHWEHKRNEKLDSQKQKATKKQ